MPGMVEEVPSAAGAHPPIVGLTCSATVSEGPSAAPRYSQNQAYVQAVVRAGGVPVLVPLVSNLALLGAAYSLLDGLLLPGGEDVGPERYGEPRHEKCGRVTPVRDEVELTLARWALRDGKPLLAICRGIQVLNVALGGSLVQDIASQIPEAANHTWYPGFPRDRLAHDVHIDDGSRLARICGTDDLPVNSLHHQAVKDLASGLTVAGQAPDGLIEAVEANDHPFAIGVQWHPEELAASNARAQRLFDALVAACRD